MSPYIVLPLVGAAIGAITNDLAIRMLFRPYRPLMVAGCKLPFTPGVIPARRHLIAASIAATFEKHLLSGADISAFLNSPAFRAKLTQELQAGLAAELPRLLAQPSLASPLAAAFTPRLRSVASAGLAQFLQDKAPALADAAVDQALSAFGPMAMLAGPFKPKIVEAMLPAIRDFGAQALQGTLGDNLQERLEREIAAAAQALPAERIAAEIAPQLVEVFCQGLAAAAAQATQGGALDLRQRLEDKINAMPVEQLEEIVLGFSRQQFRHITIAGALLGGLIGFSQAALSHILG